VVRSRIAVLAVTGLSASLLAAAPAVATSHTTRPGCPKAESLVPKAHLRTHQLAKGIRLSSGVANDQAGRVVIHVLRANVHSRHVRIKPLVRHLAERSPLSSLAAHRHRLVAATNTGYFDFRTGAPVGPFISRGRAVMLSTRHEQVAGLGTNGRLQAGEVWLSGHLSVGSSTHPLSAVNELRPPDGLAVYTPAWGDQVGVRGESRPVVNGVVGSLSGNGSGHHSNGRSGSDVPIPAHGEVVVATSQSAQTWLEGLHTGSTLTTSIAVSTSAPERFTQAYGVGSQIVAQAGHPLTGFSCDSSNTRLPARTSIGYAKGGRQLIVVTVDDHPGTTTHGLDEDQMSKLMVQLGASSAFAFDGSGSTEMLARRHGTTTLSLRTYPGDGVERPMPLGLGIYTHR
jgi:hypothetical protein